MISGEAYAKVNLGLRVGRLRQDGFHPVDGIFQSVGIVDRMSLASSYEDSIAGERGRPVAEGLDNLGFRAVVAVRSLAKSTQPLSVTLDKSIPAAAGLGGGSADAALGLGLAGMYFGLANEALAKEAPRLGSDVPFCLIGGTARVSGRGENVETLDLLTGFALAVVVPPVEIATPAAFRRWDELGEPEGPRVEGTSLPPALRDEHELRNDLYPAAVSLAPELDDWRRDLARIWGRPVMLSGSGPSLYGFFVDRDEAAAAVAEVPTGSRFADACELLPRGWNITDR